ncbi:MAG: CRISPR-associated protein Cas5, Hmari subtype [Thermotoga sp. 50_1627]|uniref:type I-B CRISPR-associated protein Cas5b n=1 Tax=Pseudothermotoga sp. TaxID=2033661 RepID=UPI00076CD600|nr:MAG: CRISPR-associated protein Cas5, Hmari subtype [Thermotoga sp. 50_64]KUK24437.1 MAG: CRISPR-associated protein Cas5, Hmari subtype [Thermotoga sp. 50_1627]MBC7117235.1 type I-B CRISPR-associated protein Cas5 [Pseudothermotoga sp.]HBT39537.1 type I-B CRISPR-associated protein Cas5 [Pseudothermotoga sp.]HCO98533.1 type I-B CRISPR-associated protein Cas5 [Pseudothermotoga sp.]
MKVLVFDVFGKYALFRRSYTTTSSTSYCFPPRTAICGLLGAILGICNPTSDSSEHLRSFDSAHFAVRLLNPVRKINIATNYVETKSGQKNPRTQILLELIKDPAYRIYVSEFEKYEELQRYLQNKICVFTPYLGQAQMIADFRYVGSFEAASVSPPLEVHTVIKILDGTKIFPKAEQVFIQERMTLNMDNKRKPTVFASYWVEKNALPIKVLQYNEPIYAIRELGENVCWID